MPGIDIAIAIQSSSSINDTLWSHSLNFVGGIMKQVRKRKNTKFGLVSFGSKMAANMYQSFSSNNQIDAFLLSLSREKDTVGIPSTLDFLFNSYGTEKYGSLSDLKVVIVLSEEKIKDSAFANLEKSYPEEDVRFLNVVLAFSKQDVGGADLGVEESKKTLYSLGEHSELVKRVQHVVPVLKEKCFNSNARVVM